MGKLPPGLAAYMAKKGKGKKGKGKKGAVAVPGKKGGKGKSMPPWLQKKARASNAP